MSSSGAERTWAEAVTQSAHIRIPRVRNSKRRWIIHRQACEESIPERYEPVRQATNRRRHTLSRLPREALHSRGTAFCYSCVPSLQNPSRGRAVTETRRTCRHHSVLRPYMLWYTTTPYISIGSCKRTTPEYRSHAETPDRGTERYRVSKREYATHSGAPLGFGLRK